MGEETAWSQRQFRRDRRPILVTRDLAESSRRLTALKNHSVEVKRGEILGVIGPNGSSKSTFFNVVTGFLKPNAGTVLFEGQEIQQLPAPGRIPLGVARTFREHGFFPSSVSAREPARGGSAAPSAWFRGCRLPPAQLGRVNRAIDQLTDEMMALIDLRARADNRAADLPYGDQRGWSSPARLPRGRAC